ncbi:MAG: sigma-70 family RNA polymerase sigma factor [bacterium]|nr:sigma-70 family RNA polymerase sigma factor [bacterium]
MIDEDVMSNVSEGNVQMLAILFERYHVRLYNYFLRLTGNKGTGEDLTQEVFFRILKYRTSYRRESKFTTWMYQIGRNVFIDHLKKHKEEMSLSDSWVEEPAPGLQPQQKTEAEQEALFLHKALAKLPHSKREILVLSRFQEMKYKDISVVLGCSLASVKIQIHRAIKDLRKIYTALKINGGTI